MLGWQRIRTTLQPFTKTPFAYIFSGQKTHIFQARSSSAQGSSVASCASSDAIIDDFLAFIDWRHLGARVIRNALRPGDVVGMLLFLLHEDADGPARSRMRRLVSVELSKLGGPPTFPLDALPALLQSVIGVAITEQHLQSAWGEFAVVDRPGSPQRLQPLQDAPVQSHADAIVPACVVAEVVAAPRGN